MLVAIGGDNLPSPVGIVLIDLPNIGGGGSGPPMATWFRHHSSNGPYPSDQYFFVAVSYSKPALNTKPGFLYKNVLTTILVLLFLNILLNKIC